jgi:hypothetical protein
MPEIIKEIKDRTDALEHQINQAGAPDGIIMPFIFGIASLLILVSRELAKLMREKKYDV